MQPRTHIIKTPWTPRTLTHEWFDIPYWQKRKQIQTITEGRQPVHLIHLANQQQAILKHYYRGGWFSFINKDRYLGYNTFKNRIQQEIESMIWMKNQQLPTPTPIAARLLFNGIFYRADMLIQAILPSCSLAAWLMSNPCSTQQWADIGKAIAQVARLGIYHRDLNGQNILLTPSSSQQYPVYLIDFDRCQRRTYQKRWHQRMLKRLLRSLIKQHTQYPQSHWKKTDWQHLLSHSF